MRLLEDKEVCEIEKIKAVVSYSSAEAAHRDQPTDLIVYVQYTDYEDLEELGRYRLDGTYMTYQKALKNYKVVEKKLLRKGFCRPADFKNFVWA